MFTGINLSHSDNVHQRSRVGHRTFSGHEPCNKSIVLKSLSDGNAKSITNNINIRSNNLQSDHEHGADAAVKTDEADGADGASGADKADEVDGHSGGGCPK